MADAAVPSRARRAGSEWFWRVLAIVMVVVIAWVAWIAYQLNPPQLATNAAFEAAAQARATRNSHGKIGGVADENPPTTHPVEAAKASAAAAEPPVNIDKLKMSDSLSSGPATEPNRASK